MKLDFSRCFLFFLLTLATPALGLAETFAWPDEEDSIIGALRSTRSHEDETLVDIAREYDLGYDQIVKANPTVNRWIPGSGTQITLPHFYILPGETRKGIVLNIAELRLYYFVPASKLQQATIHSFPVSIGRMDWNTPLGKTKVVKKDKNPAWYPPRSIREEHALDGEILPEMIPGGTPENPLGNFALRLGFPGYLIHGVDERKVYGIGMRVTHGCIRMYPNDIEYLYSLVAVRTPVEILNQPIKLGWLGNKLFLEVHQPLDDGETEGEEVAPRISLEQVLEILGRDLPYEVKVDRKKVASITEEGSGIPQEIAERVSVLDLEYQQAVREHVSPIEDSVEIIAPRIPEEPRRITNFPHHSPNEEMQREFEKRY